MFDLPTTAPHPYSTGTRFPRESAVWRTSVGGRSTARRSSPRRPEVLGQLPAHPWRDQRRKRGYVNQVLARGEVDSSYRPARRLWTRMRHGHYLPNPAMSVRIGHDWCPVYEAFALEWIETGSADDPFEGTPSQWLSSAGAALQERLSVPFGDALKRAASMHVGEDSR